MNNPDETRDIVVEDIVPHRPEVVWRALTEGQLIEQWLMPNDFQPVLGRKFTFRTKPIGGWDGIVHCEITRLEPYQTLAYSWVGGSDSNPAFGSKLNSTVTWTLSPVAGGTRVRMVHAGFRSPGNDFAYSQMSPGWGRVLKSIQRVVETLATGG